MNMYCDAYFVGDNLEQCVYNFVPKLQKLCFIITTEYIVDKYVNI